MLASRDSFLESIQKTHLIQSQVARITLLTLEIQFFFDNVTMRAIVHLKVVMRIDKLNRHDHFNSNNTC